MSNKVEKFVRECISCSTYVDKKTKEPIQHHESSKNWDTVAVDLFGPMPTSKHVVVVHDIASRFPAAKIVQSTKADTVLPVRTFMISMVPHQLKFLTMDRHLIVSK